MRLYLLKLIGKVGYDEYNALIVRATSPQHARALAAEHDYRNRNVWLYADASDCTVVRPAGKPGIILGSFNAG